MTGEIILVDYDIYIVKGHVTDEEFVESCKSYPVYLTVDEIKKDIERVFARWVPDSTGEYDMRMYFENKPKRGNFPVTVLEY